VYLEQLVVDALREDGRVGELGLHVSIEDEHHVVVSGSVSTESRRDAVPDVVREVLAVHGAPGADVRNETDVPPRHGCGGEEQVS
jgi:hypothetical protein